MTFHALNKFLIKRIIWPFRHHRKQQRQRDAVHRTDEVPPTKRNPSSPTSDGDAGSNGAKLDLLTDLPTNLSDGELPINIDTHKTSRDVEEREEEVEIKDETAKAGVEATHGIHDTVKPTDTNDFLRGGHTRDPENLDDSNDQRNASSSSHGIDLTDFVDGSTPPILELGVVRKSSESSTPRDDPSAPSASRTPDDHVSGMIANTAGDLTSSSLTAPPAAHQGHYRGVADQFEGSPTRKSARNRLQAHRDRRCRSNRLRTIGNTRFSNRANRYWEYITRREVLHDDNEHHRNRDDNNANVSRRHSKAESVARRNNAFVRKRPAVRASTAAGAAPAAKRIRINSRRSIPIADRATHVQCQTQFVKLVAGVTVCEYEGVMRNLPRVQQAPRSSQDQLLVLNRARNRLGINRFDEAAYLGLIRLIARDLSCNAPARIDARTLRDVFFLRTIDLQKNTIDRIESDAILPLYDLHTLEPSEKRLHKLGAQRFNGLLVLNQLTLSGNAIASLDLATAPI
ncbi:hypothetical protein WN51_08221 [Melipona quadrifasciata]|uniref:Uncharacterized protein n=1 Tax=Melipona quadrifasciata TaxID=166423 RepID=A0A0M8ZNB8_9HYME|nr:hypothetical protein WN51_08221 [Melipona quadrifasciata]